MNGDGAGKYRIEDFPALVLSVPLIDGEAKVGEMITVVASAASSGHVPHC